MRSDNQVTCSGNKQSLDIKGILCYAGSSGGIPTTAPQEYYTECVDEDHSLHVPIVPFDVSAPDITWSGDVSIGVENNLFRWFISGNTFSGKWDNPTVLGILDNGEPPNYSGDLLINAPNKDEWIYILVESSIPLPHPLHLHGHVSCQSYFCATVASQLTSSGLLHPRYRHRSLRRRGAAAVGKPVTS